MKNKLPKIILLSSVIGVFTLTTQFVSQHSTVFSQVERGFTAMPPRLGEDNSISLAPGEKTQVSVNVINNSQEVLDLESFAKDMIVDENGSTPVPVKEETSNRWALSSWLTLTPSRHNLQPRETARVNILIEVPTDALPGGHYAMILHQPVSNKVDAGEEIASSGVSQRTGTLLYVKVEGPINEQAFIRGFAFPKFTEYGPVPFEFKVENMSDIHISPQIGVEIYNLFGKKVETIPVSGKNIFPLTSRDFSGSWNKSWGWGYYRSKLVMSFGEQGQVAMAHTDFWFFPAKIAISIITLILSIVVILLSIRRHLAHRRQEELKKMEALQQKVKELENSGQEKLK